MLPRPLRVVHPDEHRELARRGVRAGTPTLVVHLLIPGPSAARPSVAGPTAVARPARAGVVVGRPVGDAVTRHRVARRLRHLLAARLGALPAATALVVRARPPAADASSQRLGADLDAAITRAVGRVPTPRRSRSAGQGPARGTGRTAVQA